MSADSTQWWHDTNEFLSSELRLIAYSLVHRYRGMMAQGMSVDAICADGVFEARYLVEHWPSQPFTCTFQEWIAPMARVYALTTHQQRGDRKGEYGVRDQCLVAMCPELFSLVENV